MRLSLLVLLVFAVLISACQPASIPASGGAAPSTVTVAGRLDGLSAASRTATATVTSTPAPSRTAIATATSTTTITPEPAGVIHVNTLEQEVYPFIQNGNCSLAEAISAANLLRVVDGCTAGVDGQTVIELLPGLYRLTRLDATPPQSGAVMVIHTSPAGSALPVIARSLTLRGNRAVLSREDAGEPFRILEILSGTTSIEDLTLQGGDAGADAWGGAVLVENAVLRLARVRFLKNRAENGAGLYGSRADVFVEDSEFAENAVSLLGGGVYLDNANATIKQARFLDNQSRTSGGGLYANRVTMEISDTLFKGNRAQTGWGGGLMMEASTASILRSQFYRNRAGGVGGAAAFGIHSLEEDFEDIQADPLEAVQNDPTIQQLFTQIPGFKATLEAAPGGQFKSIRLDIQVHDSCFKGNETDYPGDTNWASALSGNSSAENNYYGARSGPGGKGPGSGDQVGRKVVFAPFLTAPPAHCNLSLAE